jgi:hypothetical protein
MAPSTSTARPNPAPGPSEPPEGDEGQPQATGDGDGGPGSEGRGGSEGEGDPGNSGSRRSRRSRVPAARRAWWHGRAVSGALPAGVALLALAVYVRSLLPGTGYSGDTAKWQFLGVVGGIPHPTGYPLYVMIDQAFVGLVPWGSAAWRANLLSAVLGAATVAALHWLLRLLGVRAAVAAATALTFGVTTTFWTQSVVAEVYTLLLLLLVTATGCLTRWRAGGGDAWLLAGLALYAVAVGHHATALLALPGIAWLVWSDWRRALSPTNVGVLTLVGVAVASQYLYLPYMSRVGGYVEHPVADLDGIVDYLSGGSFRRYLFTFGPGEVLDERVPLLGRFLWNELAVLLVPAAYGLARALRVADRARRDAAVHLALLAVSTAIFALNFDVPDVVVFCLPLFLALAVFLGVGLEGVTRWWAAHLPAGRPWIRQAVTLAGAAALVALPVVTGLVDYRRASQRGTVHDAERIERALDVAGRHAVIVTDGYHDTMYVLYYLLAEGLGAERDLVLARQVTPSEVVAHLEGEGGQVTRAVRQARGGHGERSGAPRGEPEIYTATPQQAVQLEAAGVELTRVARDVWRIDGLAR